MCDLTFFKLHESLATEQSAVLGWEHRWLRRRRTRTQMSQCGPSHATSRPKRSPSESPTCFKVRKRGVHFGSFNLKSPWGCVLVDIAVMRQPLQARRLGLLARPIAFSTHVSDTASVFVSVAAVNGPPVLQVLLSAPTGKQGSCRELKIYHDPSHMRSSAHHSDQLELHGRLDTALCTYFSGLWQRTSSPHSGITSSHALWPTASC